LEDEVKSLWLLPGHRPTASDPDRKWAAKLLRDIEVELPFALLDPATPLPVYVRLFPTGNSSGTDRCTLSPTRINGQAHRPISPLRRITFVEEFGRIT
jgi:hypothetical protein